MSLNAKHIEAFLSLVKYKTVSHAAKELGISQPGLSKTILSLEAILNVELFHRVGRRLVINTQGTLLVPVAEQYLESLWNLKACVASQEQGLRGVLNIGATSSIANTVLPKLVVDFGKLHPFLSIKVIAGNYSHTIRNLLEHRVDVGLVATSEYGQDWETSVWCQDELQVFCNPQHPLASSGNLELRDLAQWEWYAREPGSGTRTLFDQVFSQVRILPTIRHEFSSNESLLRAVEQGSGLGCLSGYALKESLESQRTVLLKIPSLVLKRTWNLVLLRHRISSPVIVAFKQYLLKDNGGR